jgi:Multiubiquitin
MSSVKAPARRGRLSNLKETHLPMEPRILHFFVNKTRLETEQRHLTGAQIKALAKVDPTDLLEERVDGRKIPIRDDQSVEIRDGEHFVTFPGGNDS